MMVVMDIRPGIVDLTSEDPTIDLRESVRPRRITDFDAAFGELYLRAFGVARRMLGDRDAAEDVAAETLARALARWDRLDPDRRVGWIVRVAANQSIDLLRRRRPEIVASVHDHTDHTTTRLDLTDAVRRLPRRQREVVSLRYFADLSERDTAAALGLSAGSVKTHLHRALGTLRGRLGDELEVSDGPAL